jgi:geranylgeranyl diphosphate synthase type I
MPNKTDLAITVQNGGLTRLKVDSLENISSGICQPAEESLVATVFRQQLASTALMVDEFIHSVLEGPPEHLYDATAHYINNGGKRLRPFLLIKSCELLGGMIEHALPIAAAIELVHNFTLVHDDIIDKDEFRHGVPTVHRRYGLPLAILGGDTLIVKAFQCITTHGRKAGLPDNVVVDSMTKLTTSCLAMSEGEALDIEMASNGKFFSQSQYLEMIAKKTGALFQTSCELGALCAQTRTSDINNLAGFGRNLGIAFQLVDDLLGVMGDPSVTRKPVGNDLRQRKKTLPIVLAMKKTTGRERQKLLRVFGTKNASASDVKEALSVIVGTGIDREVRDTARLYATKAMDVIKPYRDCDPKDSLQSVVDFVVERTF